MARHIGAELVARLKHMNDSLMPITPSESDSPQPVAREAEIDALEYVVHQGIIGAYDRPILLAWLARLQAERTPPPPSTPGEGTVQDGCTLTDAEREAIARSADVIAKAAESRGDMQTAWYLVDDAATLRGLLERTSNG